MVGIVRTENIHGFDNVGRRLRGVRIKVENDCPVVGEGGTLDEALQELRDQGVDVQEEGTVWRVGQPAN